MRDRGFSLVEVLVAVLLLAFAFAALAQVFLASSQATADARRATLASVLAAQKLEELRSVANALVPQSVSSLDQNVDGLCDFLDEHGRPLGTGTRPPPGTVFVRRWAVESLPADPIDTWLLRVAVVPQSWRGSRGADGRDPRLFSGAELVTIHTRRAR